VATGRAVSGDDALLQLFPHHVVSRALQHEQQRQIVGFVPLRGVDPLPS
jgi:hypothetical protein